MSTFQHLHEQPQGANKFSCHFNDETYGIFCVVCMYPAFTLHKIYPQVLKWRHKEIKFHDWNYHTKEPIILYWHSSLKLIKQLFSNPALPTVLNTMPMY